MWIRVSGRVWSIRAGSMTLVWGTVDGPSKGPLMSSAASPTPMKDIIRVVMISLTP